MLIVKKFGGSSVADKERILNVAERCVEEYKKGNDVVVVLSPQLRIESGKASHILRQNRKSRFSNIPTTTANRSWFT